MSTVLSCVLAFIRVQRTKHELRYMSTSQEDRQDDHASSVRGLAVIVAISLSNTA